MKKAIFNLKALIAFIVLLGAVFCLATITVNAENCSGVCGAEGDNLTWKLYEDGTLVIDGEGAMADYDIFSYDNYQPWSNYAGMISTIVLPDGLTHIGNYAFYGCGNIESITIPESVTSIGSGAFMYCTSLKSIDIPDSVTEIGAETFQNCYGLESVKLPKYITVIEPILFLNCKSLKTIDIPAGVTSIGWDAFSGCTLLTEVTIPEGVEILDECAFEGCTNLEKVYCPKKLWIMSKVFNECYKLVLYVYDDSDSHAYAQRYGIAHVLIDKGPSVIAGCGTCGAEGDNLTWKLYDDGTLVIDGEGAMADYEEILSDNNHQPWSNYIGMISTIVLPDGLTYIGNFAFSGCENIESITIPESVTSIGSGAFAKCTSLKSINIPDSVTEIGAEAYQNCYGLESVKLPKYITVIEPILFQNCKSLKTIDIPVGVTSIGWDAFSGCTLLTEVTIPEGVEILDECAFEGCTNLEKVYCPKSLEFIDKAFSGCYQIKLRVYLGSYAESYAKKGGFDYSLICTYYGDFDGDDVITNSDISLIIRHISGWSLSHFEFETADCNMDNKINNRDAIWCIQKLAGWPEKQQYIQ